MNVRVLKGSMLFGLVKHHSYICYIENEMRAVSYIKFPFREGSAYPYPVGFARPPTEREVAYMAESLFTPECVWEVLESDESTVKERKVER